MATKKKIEAPPAPQVIETYGCRTKNRDQNYYDQFAFCWRTGVDFGAPRRIELFKRWARRVNPTYFEWHDWTEKLIEAACEEQWLAIAGCSSSSKTWNITGYACCWWLASPCESSVIYCSTSLKALKRRGWQAVQHFYTTIPGPRLGNFVDSQLTWQSEKGDSKNAIFAIAVEDGNTTQNADKIKGVHTKRQLVIIDEATAVPPAIFEAITNLYGSPREFQLIMLGNPRSRLDEFGRYMEPLKGWGSVNVDSEEWQTTPKIDGKPGFCIRFDAEKSPNITQGRIVSKYLPTKEKVEARRKALSSENDPSYWSNERGFPPPEGLNKTVISESIMEAHGAYQKHEFITRPRVIGFLDPARTGGDRAALMFGKLGEIKGGEWGLELGVPIIIRVNAKSSNPIDYQIVEQVQRECGKIVTLGPQPDEVGWWCAPENFGLDATGGGADLGDIFHRLWSPKVKRVVFSESASEEPCSHEDMRNACDVYKNKRAEMYFRAANAVKSGQLKGFDRETAKEFTSIEFDDSKPRIVLMAKDEYRLKFGKSCDYSDCAVGLVEVARRLGFKLAAVGKTVDRGKEFSEVVEKVQNLFASVDYSEEEDMELAYDD